MNLLGGAGGVQKLQACVVERNVLLAEPRAFATRCAVCCSHGQVLQLAHCLYLLDDASGAVQTRAGERQHERRSRSLFLLLLLL